MHLPAHCNQYSAAHLTITIRSATRLNVSTFYILINCCVVVFVLVPVVVVFVVVFVLVPVVLVHLLVLFFLVLFLFLIFFICCCSCCSSSSSSSSAFPIAIFGRLIKFPFAPVSFCTTSHKLNSARSVDLHFDLHFDLPS